MKTLTRAVALAGVALMLNGCALTSFAWCSIHPRDSKGACVCMQCY